MNVKPGDLAITIRAVYTPENVGRIVEVIGPVVQNEMFICTDGTYVQFTGSATQVWRVRSARPLFWRLKDGRVFELPEVPAYDSNLRPVSGIPERDEVKDELHA